MPSSERHAGNLRLHPIPPEWSRRFDVHLAGCIVKASDAFGTLYRVTPSGTFAVFDPDVLEPEDLGVPFARGMAMIDEDADLIR